MDVATVMQIVAEAPPAKSPGKPAWSGERSEGFAGIYAGLVTTDDTDSGESGQEVADASGQTGVPMGLLAFLPFIPTVTAPTVDPAVDTAAADQMVTAAVGQVGLAVTAVMPQPVPLTTAGANQVLITPATTGVKSESQPGVMAEQAIMAAPVNPAVPGMTVTYVPPQPADGETIALQPQPVVLAAVAPAASEKTAAEVTTTPVPADYPLLAAPQGETVRAATPVLQPGQTVKPYSPTDSAVESTPGQTVATVTTKADTPDNEQSLANDTPAPVSQTLAKTAETSVNPQVFAAVMDQKTAPLSAADSPARSDAPLPAAADAYDVASQIVDNARLITRAETSEMVIRLKPEHLGVLTLRIAVENGTVSATFHSPNPEVRGAIEASLTQLKQDMANQGLKVDNVGVYASLDQSLGHGQQQAAQQQVILTARRDKADESFQDAAATVSAIGQQTTAGGIDYRI